WPDLGRAVERVAHAAGAQLADEALEERVGHGLDDDEALGGDAALAAVDEPGVGRRARRGREVGVGEDDERIAAAQLEHGLLQLAAGLPGHFAAGDIAAA